MKVSTDSCLLGAWFADQAIRANTILDIGAGSGLLTLMLAQKNPATFHAIEKEPDSFLQLQQNIKLSPWKDRINALHGDAITHAYPVTYDLIISNPPFYENELRSPDHKKNMAMHDNALTLDVLVKIIDNNLAENGSFGILLPYYRKEQCISVAEQLGFRVIGGLDIRQTPAHAFFRCIMHFSKSHKPANTVKELTIKNTGNEYTPEFMSLLKDYYLAL